MKKKHLLSRFLDYNRLISCYIKAALKAGNFKNLRVLKLPLLSPIFLFLFLFFSCDSSHIRYLETESLFFIPIGILPDEIDFFLRDNFVLPGSSAIVFHDDFFYISASSTGKIMKMNTYGELLGLIYNPEKNPSPYEFKLENSQEVTNRINKEWSFRRMGELAVSSDYIYVQDTLALDRVIRSDNMWLDNVILRFDKEGNYVDYISQEGIGGDPFPPIQSIKVRNNNEVVVLCQSDNVKIVYWFDADGVLLYTLNFLEDRIPRPDSDSGWNSYISNIIPSQTEYKIYLEAHYFKDDISRDRLLTFDLSANAYSASIEIPSETLMENGMEFQAFYEYIGTVGSKAHLFLASGEPGFYNLLILRDDGKITNKRKISLDQSDILYKRFFLTQDGLLMALFYEEKGARVVWWRVDKLM